jgi:DNA modification methylase
MRAANGDSNKLQIEDRAAHDWYRFVLSYPPHLVREYLNRFGITGSWQVVLDPFCGTGTTVVECKKLGVPSIGIEANPMAHFAAQTKTEWAIVPDALIEHAEAVAESARNELDDLGTDSDVPTLFGRGKSATAVCLRELTAEQSKLLLADSISPLPLHRTLVLLDHLMRTPAVAGHAHERLCLAKALVFSISNLHFGPEVGVGPPRQDAPVVDSWLAGVRSMARDLRLLAKLPPVPAQVIHSDARSLTQVLESNSIDAVITSPPYPNEKDYTRTTRLESVLLGFIRSKPQLQLLKKGLVRSNTRGVYIQDDDDRWVADHPEIQRIASAIEARRVELKKTSGFERMYARVTRLYFGGMARHLAELRQVLRPGAQLAYVVGDQASYLRVMIRTGELLADIARSLGYEVTAIDLFRTRLATATREQLREEVVLLRWPGGKS